MITLTEDQLKFIIDKVEKNCSGIPTKLSYIILFSNKLSFTLSESTDEDMERIWDSLPNTEDGIVREFVQNGFDESYFDRLKRGEHLNERFLNGAE